ncbi:MAG: PDZ domain-containing protein [Rhodobacteraceae bacterium]|nr:PDZ domain-containing protein [Paracoccaceae bacterium]
MILSNAHVVDDHAQVRLTFLDGRQATARVRATDPLRDIAILTTRAELPPGLLPAPSAVPGTVVFATGAPLEAGFSVTGGVISAPARQVEANLPLRLLQHDAAVNPGSSGGPLVDSAGRQLGMNSRIADGSRYYVGISYAIRAADLARHIPRMLAAPAATQPRLGLRVRDLTPRLARALGRQEGSGILIDHVGDNTVAARAGLQAGDVLTRANGHVLRKSGDLAFALDDLDPRSPVLVEVIRVKAPMTLNLDLSASPQPDRPPPAPDARQAPFTLAALGIRLGRDRRVIDLSDRSAVFEAGLAEGDRVMALNGMPFDPATAPTALFDAPVLLRVSRQGLETHILIDPRTDTRRLRSLSGNQLDLAVVVF